MLQTSLLLLSSALSAMNLADVERAPVPADGVAIAATDAARLGPEAVYVRYVWIPNTEQSDARAVAFAANYAINRASVLAYPETLTDGRSNVVRLDLRAFVPQENDFQEIVEQWERFQGREPYFTAAVERLVGKKTITRKLDEPRRIRGGRTVYEEQIEVDDIRDVRSLGPHTGTDAAAQLMNLTGSNIPIVRHDWFIRTVLSTLDGGAYYELRGIQPSPNDEQTDYEFFLRSFGADEKLVRQLRTDQRTAQFRSGVTGKPRAVAFFRGAGGRPSVNTGLVTVTLDVADNETDPDKHPLLDLVDFEFAASEVILESQNGLQVCALFDGQGKLAREVPPNIAVDDTISAPHTKRLQPAISCIRCHARTESNGTPADGYRATKNDVLDLIGDELDIFGQRKPKFDADVTDRLVGLYTGDLTKPLRRARDDYAEAVLRCTKGMSIAEATDATAEIYRQYWYDLVTPEIACRELGLKVQGANAATALRAILPPDVSLASRGIVPEHGFIAALRAGVPINRLDWEQVYVYAATRVLEMLSE